MSRYYESGRRKRKSLRERIGFYTAFAICLLAVSMAVYSTYNTVSLKPATAKSSAKKDPQPVVQPVTGISVPVPTIGVIRHDPGVETYPDETEPRETETPASSATEAETGGEMNEAMQTLLSVDLSLSPPTKPGKVTREYNKDSVYYKTINVWKPHTGADFACELGDDVLAMVNGSVTKISDDKLYGKTVEISSGNAVVSYCGLGEIKVREGDSVNRGDVIALAGAVPCEAADSNHIHIGLMIDGKTADPLNFIGNE